MKDLFDEFNAVYINRVKEFNGPVPSEFLHESVAALIQLLSLVCVDPISSERARGDRTFRDYLLKTLIFSLDDTADAIKADHLG